MIHDGDDGDDDDDDEKEARLEMGVKLLLSTLKVEVYGINIYKPIATKKGNKAAEARVWWIWKLQCSKVRRVWKCEPSYTSQPPTQNNPFKKNNIQHQ